MKIKEIFFKQLFNSRGEKTLEAEILNFKNLAFKASVPSGKSKGEKEVFILNPAETLKKYYLDKIKTLKNKNFKSIKDFDSFLLKLDGTKNKSKLGGNVTLALSLAFGRALAFERGMPLWQNVRLEFLKNETKNFPWKPVIFSNLINGGMHASNNLDIQEYLILAPILKDATKTIEDLIKFYKILGKYLIKRDKLNNLAIGDEGGYSLNFKNNLEPLLILNKLIKENKFLNFSLGIDAAASSFRNGGKYFFENKKISSSSLKNKYLKYFRKVPLLQSIEDPFSERDLVGFKVLNDSLQRKNESKIIIGDDLVVTNSKLLETRRHLINGVIIKPNQIGTISETMETCLAANKYGIKTIFSHRSGETEDVFIIELAFAVFAFGVKIGAPARERMLKFNELLRLSE
jgi:enolase